MKTDIFKPLTIAWMAMKLCVVVVIIQSENIVVVSKNKHEKDSNLVDMMQFLLKDDKRSSELIAQFSEAEFNYDCDLSEENGKKTKIAKENVAKGLKKSRAEANTFAWQDLDDDDILYRWFKLLTEIGDNGLPKEKLDKMQNILDNLTSIYSEATVKLHSCSAKSLTDLEEIMAKSENINELTNIWKKFRDVSGKKVKKGFLKVVEILNEASKLVGYENAWEMWMEPYEDKSFMKDMKQVFKDIEPLYQQMHAYARQKLRKIYKGHIRPHGPIPAQLFGDMEARHWDKIKHLQGYPEKKSLNVTPALEQQKFTPKQMVAFCEKFYLSLGLKNLTCQFWENSMFVEKEGIDSNCHASAHDVRYPNDVRLKMCIKPEMEDLFVIYHELGHIQYFLQYQEQPSVFRNGANPGFHEAVGDTMLFFASNPRYMKKLGLQDDVADDYESDINFLLSRALRKVALLPFAYLVDVWRSQVFEGKISKQELNSKWWEYRLKYQGICPPVRRTEHDFDPGALFHVAAFVEYIRYFFSGVLSYQFFEALCDECGYEGELHKCSIDNCKKAGTLYSKMLSKGNSLHWHDVMKIITKGKTKRLDASSMLKYFKPLMKWLETENKNEIIGWSSDDPNVCPSVY